MGLFDKLTFEDRLEIGFPEIGAEPIAMTWQIKSLPDGFLMMENYKITAERRLFKEQAEYEQVPEEERPGYDETIGGFANEFERWRGSMKKTHGWTDTEYHGTFEFHRTIGGKYVSLEATFTDGRLVDISRNPRAKQ